MLRCVFVAVTLTAVLAAGPSFAISAKDKMETCKFGADDQKLAGAARSAFIRKCLANKNDPRGPAGAAGPGTGASAAPPPKQ